MDKRNKRFLSMALVLVLIIGLMPTNIASLGDDSAAQKLFYRWEINDAGDGLKSIDGGCYTGNVLTVNTTKNTSADGTLNNFVAMMANEVTLSHDEPWVVEWKAGGDWNGMLLSHLSGISQDNNDAGGHSIFRTAANKDPETRQGIAIGAYKDADLNSTGYAHFGVDKPGVADYMDATVRTYRLENRVDDGVYFVIDGTTEIAMTTAFGVTTEATAEWLKTEDFTFNAIGTGKHPITSMKLEYLEIMVNGECEHTYGDWKTVSGKKLKECTMCGDTQAWEAYRWEINEAGNALESVTTGAYTKNDVNKVSGSIADDTLTSYVGTMAAGITLEHDKAWVIEWEASGDWGGMLLCDVNDAGVINTAGNYIFRNAATSTIGLGIGAYKDQTLINGYGHFGVAKNTIAAYISDATHNYRLENQIVGDTNTIWFVIDGHIEFEMTTALVSNMLADAATWLSGQDLYFDGFGKTGHALNGMKLEYLEILVDGECDHSYGQWTVVEGTKQRVCADCGRIDNWKAYRWEIVTNGETQSLESVTTGGYTQNNLTPNEGGKIDIDITDGKISKYSAMLDTGLLLKHDEEWVIQWQSKGNWDGMLLSELGANISNPEVGGNYIFRNSSNSNLSIRPGITLGIYKDADTNASNFGHFGVSKETTKNYVTDMHAFRLENRVIVDAQGNYVSNMVYLVIDGTVKLPMSESNFGTTSVEAATWFNGRDFYFNAIGTSSHPLNNITLGYLEVMVNGDLHTHDFGEWAYNETSERVQRDCRCGETEIANVVIDDAGAFTGFATFEEALQAAANSEYDVYVMLFEDQTTEDVLDLPENVGIDLNGHNLTAAGLVSNGYGIIDRTGDKGALNVPKDAFAPGNTENADHLPIWNGEDGYVFINRSDVAAFRAAGAAPANGEATFFFRPEISATINAYLAGGAEVSGVKLCVQINYTRDGVPKSVVGVYNDELIAKFYDGYDPQTDTYTKAFKLSLTGVEGVTDLSYEIYYEAQGVHVTIAEYAPEVSAGE